MIASLFMDKNMVQKDKHAPLINNKISSSFLCLFRQNCTFLEIINIISYILIVVIIYFFLWDLRMFDFIQILIFSIFSFAISMFISDKFKLSNNKFIRILQKLVFINIIIALFGLIVYLFDISISTSIFCEGDEEIGVSDETPNTSTNETEVQITQDNIKTDSEGVVGGVEGSEGDQDIVQITSNKGVRDSEYYSFKIKKDLIDSVWEKGTDIIVSGVKDLGPNLGIGAAVGKIGSEVIKNTSGMAPAPRMLMVGTSALATAVGTKVGIELGKALMENKKINSEIEASTLTRINQDGRNTPTDFDGGFIHSVLEKNEIEIPLLSMVNGLCYLNYIEFILILSLFSLLFRKYLIKKFFGTWSSNAPKESVSNRLIGTKISSLLRYKIFSLNNTFYNLDKYTDYLTVFIFICLIWIKLINIYFTSHLAVDIDSFVNVYNHIKNNSFTGLFFSLSSLK